MTPIVGRAAWLATKPSEIRAGYCGIRKEDEYTEKICPLPTLPNKTIKKDEEALEDRHGLDPMLTPRGKGVQLLAKTPC